MDCLLLIVSLSLITLLSNAQTLAVNQTLDPTSYPTSNPTVFFTTAPPTPIGVNVSDAQIGIVGTSSSLTFALSLATNYESLTVSTCSNSSFNQFDTSLSLLNATNSVIATDTNTCPDNTQQTEIVITNVLAGSYNILFSGLDGAASAADLWALSVTASTFAPSAAPTNPTSTPTPAPIESGSDSGSGSGSGSDSSDDAAYV